MWTVRKRWVGIAFGLVGLLIAGISFYLDAILRASIERNINRQLKGFSVHIRAASFHPIGFSLDLLDATAVQTAHPDPPVLRIPRLHASVQWRALLHGRLVADFLIERPKLYLNLNQARTEIKNPTPLRERGWQEALEAIYPLKVNEFRVRDAELTYVDQGPFRPLQLSRVNFRADNIRNINSPEHVYPSEFHLDGVVFNSGRVVLDGNADFLAEPHVGLQGSIELEGIDLDYFKPITSRYNVTVRRGTLSTLGIFEYAPRTKVVDLQEISIRDVGIEYVHKPETAVVEDQTVRQIQRTATQVSNSPEILLRVDKVNVLQSAFGYRNEAADPPYRLFLADAEIHFTNVSNQHAEGKATGSVKGKFMGSGDSTISLTFSPVGKKLDFDLTVRIDGTELPAMNDLLRASAGFDVGGGQFSFYSEVNARQGNITGYAKPLFKDITFNNQRQDRKKGFFQGFKQGLVEGAARLLENPPRREVGTKINISGTLDSPEYSTWEAVGGFLKNAFLKAILPGLEKEAGRRRG